jgi:hypothetical protein
VPYACQSPSRSTASTRNDCVAVGQTSLPASLACRARGVTVSLKLAAVPSSTRPHFSAASEKQEILTSVNTRSTRSEARATEFGACRISQPAFARPASTQIERTHEVRAIGEVSQCSQHHLLELRITFVVKSLEQRLAEAEGNRDAAPGSERPKGGVRRAR